MVAVEAVVLRKSTMKEDLVVFDCTFNFSPPSPPPLPSILRLTVIAVKICLSSKECRDHLRKKLSIEGRSMEDLSKVLKVSTAVGSYHYFHGATTTTITTTFTTKYYYY